MIPFQEKVVHLSPGKEGTDRLKKKSKVLALPHVAKCFPVQEIFKQKAGRNLSKQVKTANKTELFSFVLKQNLFKFKNSNKINFKKTFD